MAARTFLVSSERRTRFGVLLLAITLAFLLEGIATTGRWKQLVASLLLSSTLVLAVWVAEPRSRVFRAVSGLAILLALLSLIEALLGDANGTVVAFANLLLVTLAPPAIVVGIIRTLRARNQVTVEAVFGTLSLYLLLGMGFAFAYSLIGRIDGSFFAQGTSSTVAHTLYFSFTTLTTVGYGDLTAASNLGHTLSVSEALLGQLYLVTVVSVIIGNLGRTRRPGRDTPPAGER